MRGVSYRTLEAVTESGDYILCNYVESTVLGRVRPCWHRTRADGSSLTRAHIWSCWLGRVVNIWVVGDPSSHYETNKRLTTVSRYVAESPKFPISKYLYSAVPVQKIFFVESRLAGPLLNLGLSPKAEKQLDQFCSLSNGTPLPLVAFIPMGVTLFAYILTPCGPWV